MKKSLLLKFIVFAVFAGLVVAEPTNGKKKIISEASGYEKEGLAFLYGDSDTIQDLELALDSFETALELLDEAEIEDKLTFNLLNDIGQVYSMYGDYASALEFYNDAYFIAQELFETDSKDVALFYNNFGQANSLFKNYDDALVYLEKSLDLYKKLDGGKDKSFECSTVYLNIAGVYEGRAEYQKALDYCNKALEIRKKLNGEASEKTAAVYSKFAGVHLLKGDLKNAESFANKAVKIQEEKLGELNSETAGTYTLLADIYAKSGNSKKALDFYMDALDIYSETFGDYHPQVAGTYYAIGMHYFAQKDYKNSIKYLKEAFELYAECQNYDVIIENALNVYFNLNGYPKKFEEDFFGLKIDAIFEGIAASEDARIDVSSRKDALLKKALPLYYAAFSLFAEFDDAKSAFYYSELLRSRGFLDEIGTETALNLDGVSDAHKKEFRELSKKIASLNRKIGGQSSQGKNGSDGASSDYKKELAEANKKLSELESEISEEEPHFEWFRNPEPVDFEEAKNWCGKERAVLEYVLFGDETDGQKFTPYCIVMSKKKVTCVPLDSSFDFAEASTEFRSLIVDGKSLSDKKLSDLNASLYKKLIEPVIDEIPSSVLDVVIVPDGAISFIPFDVLSPNGKDFFGSAYNLSMSASVSVSMMNEEKNASKSKKMLGIGNAVYSASEEGNDRAFTMKFLSGGSSNQNQTENLLKKYAENDEAGRYFVEKDVFWTNIPGTGEEIHNIQDKVFGKKKFEIIEKADASEDKIKTLSESKKLLDYQVLHFACHGYFDSEYPQMSSIVFSEVSSELDKRGKQDGYLTLQEASLLNINSELVNLSACQTGLAKINKGDGMTGLVRSFLVAGSKKVGVTLWCVDDEATCEFMTRMYSKVNDLGLTYQEAYSAVKEEFRSSQKWSSPYYWAAFILYE